MQIIKVKFTNKYDNKASNTYYFWNELDVKKYDVLLVPTSEGVSLAIVTEVDCDEQKVKSTLWGLPTKTALEKIETNYFKNLEVKEEKEKIEQELKAKIKKFNRIPRYDNYKGYSKDYDDLLEEYDKVLRKLDNE